MNSDFRLAVTFAFHPKFIRLCRKLGDTGGLSWIRLLAHVAANKPDGRLTGMDDEGIAIAAGYPNDGEKFVNVLVELRLLDRLDGSIVIHDWERWNPWAAKEHERGEAARRSARARWARTTPEQRSQEMRRVRAGDSTATCVTTSIDVQSTCDRTSSTCDSTCSSPFLSDPTSRDLGNKQISSEEEDLKNKNKACAEAPAAFSLSESSESDKAQKKTPRFALLLNDGFEEFWKAYPADHRKEKAEAHKAWKKLRPDAALRKRILADLPRFLDQSYFNPVPYPQRYLKHKRWEDEAARGSPATSTVSHGGLAYRPASEVLREQYTEEELRQIQERRRKQG